MALGAVWETVRTVRIVPLLVAIVLATLAFPIRVARWRALLHTPEGRPLPGRAGWHAVAIGFMGNNVLPVRAGELLRAFTISRLTTVPFAAAVSSLAMERVFDGLTLLALLVAGLFASGFSAGATIGGVVISTLATRIMAIATVLLAASFLVMLRPGWIERTIHRLLPWPRAAQTFGALVHTIGAGLAALRTPRRLVPVVVWSLVLWLVNALSFFLTFRAFEFPLPLAAALVLQGIVAFGIAVPSSPGFVGVFEASAVAALALYEIPKDLAFAYAATYHVTTFVPITAFGLWSVARTSIGFGTLRTMTIHPPAHG